MEHLLLLGLVGGRGLITALLLRWHVSNVPQNQDTECTRKVYSLDRFIEHALQIPLGQG